MESKTIRRFALRGALLSGAVALLLGSGIGCGKLEHLASTGTDDNFIRTPGEQPKAVEMPKGPLLPLSSGHRWTYAVETNDPRKWNDTPARKSIEELRIGGNRKVGDTSGVAVQIFQNGKLFREEVFRLDKEGLFLTAAGINNARGTMDTLSISPGGIPLVRFPIQPGDALSWDGIMRLSSRALSAPGTSFSRVSAIETVETPAGKFPAYKIETLITTTIDRQQIELYSARWFSPGVGLVRQRILTGPQEIRKVLIKHQPARTAQGKASNAASPPQI
ncbi:MAG: hypothetical protein OHK0029_38120 [Armatimonadaceae bacterium]